MPHLVAGGVHSINQFMVPGEEPRMILDFKWIGPDDLADSGTFFAELIIWRDIEVEADLATAFHAKDKQALERLLKVAEDPDLGFEPLLDFLAGSLGLRFHRQFVIRLLAENPVAFREDDPQLRAYGDAMEMLEPVTLLSQGQEQLARFLSALDEVRRDKLAGAGKTLAWLRRGWEERDPIEKFLWLFIPLERALSGVSPPREEFSRKSQVISTVLSAQRRWTATWWGRWLRRLGLLKPLLVADDDFVGFFSDLCRRSGPSLADRFEHLARSKAAPGFEADIAAFRRFNGTRSRLLHRGDPAVALRVEVSEEDVRTLEDLAERYVSYAIFEDGVVYGSRRRPKR